MLNRIYKEYKLPLDLFIKIKKSMGYESQKAMNDLHNFIQELPHKLKTEVSLYVYEQRYNKIKFFRNRNVSFILWMCPILKPQIYTEHQYVYLENERIQEMYFLITGEAAFVLPRYKGAKYIIIREGNHFGIIDIVGSCQTQDIDITEWYKKKALMFRQFSIQSTKNSEALSLDISLLY